MKAAQCMPEVRTVRHYHDHRPISPLAAQVEAHWRQLWPGAKLLLMSKAALPLLPLDKGDPTGVRMPETGRLLATEALGLAPPTRLW